jgi:hypothetical protein
MNPKTVDRDVCRLVRAALEKALPEIGKQLGMHLSIQGGGSFCPDNVTYKVQAAVIGASGQALTKEASAFKLYAKSYGLDPSDLNKTIKYAGTEYEIVGCKPRSYRFPIMAKRTKDGRGFKLPADAVARALGRTVKSGLTQTAPPFAGTHGEDGEDESGDSFSGVAGPAED